MKTKKIWRLLERGEKIQKGDQWWDDSREMWERTERIGLQKYPDVVYRRRITIVCGSDEKAREG